MGGIDGCGGNGVDIRVHSGAGFQVAATVTSTVAGIATVHVLDLVTATVMVPVRVTVRLQGW